MPKLLGGLTRVAADVLFPPQCALCSAGGTLLCDTCADALPRAEGQRCERCFAVLQVRTTCRGCMSDPPRFLQVRSAFSLRESARNLVHMLKYENLSSLGEPMGTLLAVQSEDDDESEVIVPVPLHRSRERERSYNQAELIARAFARLCERTLDAQAVRRIKATEPLASGTTREERRAIVAGAFAARPDRVEGRRVLLIDDVVTTGATLDSCAAALLDAGAAEVRCLTWARAD
jgi:ComF family protein